MLTTRSCFVALLGLLLSACGGSVSEESGAGGTGGASGSGGGAGSGGFSGGGGGGGDNGLCFYQGEVHYPNSTWTASDGCNTCHCSEWGGNVSCTKLACASTCEYGGKTYQEGETFPANDGCNSCTCGAGGTVMCTTALCAATCMYAGTQYPVGASFAALDGCNKCTCTDQGVSCTELACPCDAAKEWWRNYVGKSPAECATIKYACPANTTAFANACGCGCEQDASCPQTIDCMPPAPDCDKWKAKCPYSGVAY